MALSPTDGALVSRKTPTTASWFDLGLESVIRFYADAHAEAKDERTYRAIRANLARTDLFYLLVYVCGRKHVLHPWLYDRCREVQAAPDGHLDAWFRDAGKSTIQTFGMTLLDIINNPEVTFGIFSHTRGIAKTFLRQHKREMESNRTLPELFPDVFWQNPHKDSPLWSEDGGLIVKRQGNPKEATIEAWGLVDGQPTSRHFQKRVYDDVVTRESVTTPEQIAKTTEAWELSDNLGTEGGVARYVGTRYALFDTYSEMLDRKVVIPRIYPATDNGRVDGNPVLWSKEVWLGKLQLQSSTLAAQLLLNPLAADQAMFRAQWLKAWEIRPRTLNIVILCDPSMGKTADSDRTAIPVVGVDANFNKWLLDGYCHRMKLSERWIAIRDLHKRWSKMPGVVSVKVGYERYGMQSDVEYFEERMRAEKYRFEIHEVAWVREGGNSKEARVQRLEPDIRLGRWRIPAVVWHETHGESTWRVRLGPDGAPGDEIEYVDLPGELSSLQRLREDGVGNEYLGVKPIKRFDEERRVYDLTREFIEQALRFPVGKDKDLVDACSRVYDMEAGLPSGREASHDPLDLGLERLPEPQVFVDGV